MNDMFVDDPILGDFVERESDALDFLYNDVGGDGNLFSGDPRDYLAIDQQYSQEQHDQQEEAVVLAEGRLGIRESSISFAKAPKRKASAKQEALNSSSSAKSTKRKSLKKAPNAPVRFKNPYIFFVQKHMALLRSVPMSVPEKMSQLAFEWARLTADQKAEFERSADLDKARYFNEMRNYDGPSHVPNKRPKKPPGAPKRAMTAFFSFSQAMRPKLHAEFPSLKTTELSSLLALRWKEASDEVRSPFQEKERRDRERYLNAMIKWKTDEDKTNTEQQQKHQEDPEEAQEGEPSLATGGREEDDGRNIITSAAAQVRNTPLDSASVSWGHLSFGGGRIESRTAPLGSGGLTSLSRVSGGLGDKMGASDLTRHSHSGSDWGTSMESRSSSNSGTSYKGASRQKRGSSNTSTSSSASTSSGKSSSTNKEGAESSVKDKAKERVKDYCFTAATGTRASEESDMQITDDGDEAIYDGATIMKMGASADLAALYDDGARFTSFSAQLQKPW